MELHFISLVGITCIGNPVNVYMLHSGIHSLPDKTRFMQKKKSDNFLYGAAQVIIYIILHILYIKQLETEPHKPDIICFASDTRSSMT